MADSVEKEVAEWLSYNAEIFFEEPQTVHIKISHTLYNVNVEDKKKYLLIMFSK